MLDEKKITHGEYENLKAEILASSADSEGDGSQTETPKAGPAPTVTPEQATQQRIQTLYKIAFGLGILSIFLGGTFGLMAWATVAVGAWALYSLKTSPGRWMAWVGLGLGIVFSFMNAYVNGHLDGLLDTTRASSVQTASTLPELPYLGFTMEEFAKNWNAAATDYQEICDLDAEARGEDMCSVPFLNDLQNAMPETDETGIWGQELLPPTFFLGDTKDGAAQVVTVWSFEATDVSDFIVQMDLLCWATYGYNEDPAAVTEKCDELTYRLLERAANNDDQFMIQETADVDGVFWMFMFFPGADGFSFQGTDDSARLIDYVG